MTKYLSGRVKVKPTSGLSTDRYNYLSLDQAEPNLGAPISPLPTVPSGTQYQIIGVDGHPGKRYWIPIQGGLIPGSISVYEEGSLVGSLSSITQLNFIGNSITAQGVNLGVAATITVAPPGVDNSVLFKDSGDFATSTGLTFDDSTDRLSVGGFLQVGTSRLQVNSVGVGIGTTDPTQELHVRGDIRLTGTIVDENNSPGTTGQVIVKTATGGIDWINQGSVSAGAGGNPKDLQYHNNAGIIDGATGFVYDSANQRVGLGVANPTVKFDLSGDAKINGTADVSRLYVSGVTTHTADVRWTDSDKAKFGDNNSLEIFSTGNNCFIRDVGAGNLYVSGNDISFDGVGGSNLARFTEGGTSRLYFAGNQKLQTMIWGVDVEGTLAADNLTVAGVATLPVTNFTGDVTVNNLRSTGISTLGNIKFTSNTIASASGNILLDSASGTVQTNDILYVNNPQNSTSKDNGSIFTEGGLGVEKAVHIGETLNVAGQTTLSGIVTTGTHFYVGGDLNVLGDLYYDELQGRNLFVTGISTFQGQINLAANIIPYADNTYDIGSNGVKFNEIFATSFKGNADTATALETSRVFSISGDGVATGVPFNGTGNVALNMSLANSGVTAATYGSTVTIPVITVDAKGRVTNVVNTGINFGTATVQQAQTVQAQTRSVDADHYLTFVTDDNPSSGTFELLYSDGGVRYNPSANILKVLEGTIEAQTIVSGNVTKQSQLSNDGSLELFKTTGNSYIDFKSALSEDYDCRIESYILGNDSGLKISTGGNGQASVALDITTDGHLMPGSDSTFNIGSSTVKHANIHADTFHGPLSGNADTTTALANTRTFTIVGDVDAPAQNFDGTGNVLLTATLDTVNSNVGTFGNNGGTSYARVTVNAKGLVTAASEVPINFLSSTVGTARDAQNIRTVGISTNANHYLTFVRDNNGTQEYEGVFTDDSIKYNPSSNLLQIAGESWFNTAGTSNKGIRVGDQGDIIKDGGYLAFRYDDGIRIYSANKSGSAKIRLTSGGDILPESNNTGKIGNSSLRWGEVWATTFNGAFQGTAASADKLTTSREIAMSGDVSWAVNFDGTTNVTSAGTLANSGVAAGTYGNTNGTQYSRFTVDAKGRVTSASNVNINFSNATVASADQLTNARDFSINGTSGTNQAGEVLASTVSFNGTAPVVLNGNLKSISGFNPNNTTYGNSTTVPTFKVNNQGLIYEVGSTGINFSTATVNQANQLTNSRTFSIGGSGSAGTSPGVTFNGTADVQLNLTLKNSGVIAGSYGSSTEVAQISVDSKGLVTSAAAVGINFSAATVNQANTVRTIRNQDNSDYFLSFFELNPTSFTYQVPWTDANLTYNPNTNLMIVPNLQPGTIQQSNGATGSAGNVPVANGSGGWAWGTASAGSSQQIFSTETDTGTQAFLTFVHGNASGTKDLMHDDQLSYIPSDNRLTVDKLRPSRLEEPGGNSGSNGEVPIANGSGSWAWGTANAGGANTVLADEIDDNVTRPIATLQGNDNAQNSVFYDNQFTYNHQDNQVTVPRARITELRSGTNNNGNNGQVAMSDGTNWNWATINITNVPSSEQVETVQATTDAEFFLTFVNSNNTTASPEDVFTHSGVRYNPAHRRLFADRSIWLNDDNVQHGGIRLSDDGDIVDLNDSWCSMRFTAGVQILDGTGQLGSTPSNSNWTIRLHDQGAIECTGNITAFVSDERLKTDIKRIESPLEKLLSLRGFTYKFNDLAKSMCESYGDEIQVGVSAQEVKKVLPEAVKPAPVNEEYMTVQYEKLVPLLIEAVKEQQETIEELKSRLEKLEG